MTNRITPGYIGPGLVLSGRLSGAGEIEVDGRLEGEVNIDGSLSVGESGEVLAPVMAHFVEVKGRLRGAVLASDEVSVREGGRLDGDVRAPRIGIDDGGRIQGAVDMEFELGSGGDA